MRERGECLSSGGTVNYGGWLLGVLCWDGMLPVFILATPQLALSFGADRSTTEFLAIVTPVLAFFVRVEVGRRRIATNHCGPILRCCQFIVFFLAAVQLVCIDALMIVSMDMNNGRLWANEADFAVWCMLMSVYFSAMLFALFPGRTPEPDPDVVAAANHKPNL